MNEKTKSGEQWSTDDIFWRSDLYPDAAALLTHAHLPVGQIKDSAVVILDANVLLQPYEIDSKELGNEIERVYRLLAAEHRLVVPGQAAREYATNRPKKITAVVRRLDAAIAKLEATFLEKVPLLENDAKFLAIRKGLDDGKPSRREAAVLLKALSSDVRADVAGDRMALLYREILAGCVADRAYSKEERESIIHDLKRRQRLKIGPGFMDEHKDDQGVGDLLIWREILDQGVARKTHCLFVSQEKKPDWWAPEGGKFQLRPELIDEYRHVTGGKSVHMVPLSVLLTLFNADPKTVNDVAEAESREQASSEESSRVFWKSARRSLSGAIRRTEKDIASKQMIVDLAESGLDSFQKTLAAGVATQEERADLIAKVHRLGLIAERARHDVSSLSENLGEMMYSHGIETTENN